MKVQELRIGNWFKGDMFGGGEYQVKPKDIENLFDDPQDDFYQPIPLTEEWLLKFGFEQNVGIASREFLIDGTIKMINHYENGFLFTTNFWLGGVFIKHVHQLQNLYFALTGEELEMK